MIGLFSFDGPLYRDVNGQYCSLTLTNEMFNRYFRIVDRLIIIVRTFPMKKTYQEVNMNLLNTDNITVVEAPNLNTLKGLLIGQHLFKNKVKDYICDADLIFARMPSTTSNLILSIALKYKKEYLVEVGGCAWDSHWNHGIRGKIIAIHMFHQEKKYVKRAKFATYVTRYFLQKRYPNKNYQVNCSNVYLKESNIEILSNRIKKIQEMDMSKVILGQAVNSIDVKYKGGYLVLRTLKKIKELGNSFIFQIVGPGEGVFLKKEAKRLGIENQLEIIGSLTKEEMIQWYQSIDIYIQPSMQEGLPRALIEAMSLGCPAIGSNVGGIPELLDKQQIFNPKIIKEITDVITSSLDKNLLIKLANDNFIKAKEYEITKIEDKRNIIFDKYKQYILDKRGMHLK